MRIRILAINRLRNSAELTLTNEYLDRFNQAGKNLGLGPAWVQEIGPISKKTEKQTARYFEGYLSKSLNCVLDACGTRYSSVGFAHLLAQWSNENLSNVTFVIGGPEGFGKMQIPQPKIFMSLGDMVFPHRLVRVILAEQLYRSTSILSGTPYHKY